MSAERPPLTPDLVSRAEKRVDFSHPILTVIDQHLPTISALNKEYEGIKDPREQQGFIATHYGFLGDAFVEANPFTLEPTDLIGIWSRAIEIFPRYQRYSLATLLTCAYAVHDIANPAWKTLPRQLLETHDLPDGLADDPEGLWHIQNRFDEITESLTEIDAYLYGHGENPIFQAAELARKGQIGDMVAAEELDERITFNENRRSPVLAEFRENFGNGFVPPRLLIRTALTKLGGRK